ncbi:MAG: hypothetical protein H6622_13395 [Halobacteriovoraceae bacterium]|nr:hypothetical protein [Halobacteriovoraceae bacterium]MCB9062511.1 hypothetical protein [Halobacteriovoraceae bacterium]
MKNLLVVFTLIASLNILKAQESENNCDFLKEQIKKSKGIISDGLAAINIALDYTRNDHERISLELIRTNITIIEFIVAYYDLEVSSLEEFHDIIKEQPISCMKGQNKEDADKIIYYFNYVTEKLNMMKERVIKFDKEREQQKRDGLSQVDFERSPGKKIEENEENHESQSGVIIG